MTDAFSRKDNSFDSVNRVRCFNHTIQLSAKALLSLFYKKWPNTLDTDGLGNPPDSDVDGDLRGLDEDETEEEDDEDNPDDGIDELEVLSDEEQEALKDATGEVRLTITKASLSAPS